VQLLSGLPMVILGQTGSGKTSFLSAVIRHGCSNQRLAILEDIPELPIEPGWIAVQSLPPPRGRMGGLSLEDLFREVLRMSPDGIILGELRGREARAFLQ